ncbi:hypothetical protein [Parabacteroides pacaensis]|uniref:hypothetical protein n=1 Tax=Parabacteroides pacaensis TaxID=2086575 RepID=UPI000D0F7B4A|nr:hypothetical protein [Parabacteroides pacaensis]
MSPRLVFLLSSLVLTTFSHAQHTIPSPEERQEDSLKTHHQILYFGKSEKVDSVKEMALIDRFYYDQFHHFQDPRAPYFLFMSRDAQLAMGIGGVVRMRGWQDWKGVMNTSGFIPYDISVPANEARSRKLGTTPAGTTLYFAVLGSNRALGNYQLHIEANFNGYRSRDFNLKKAFATVNDWTIGYTNSTFSDPAGTPPLVDGQGPNAEVRTTAVLLRWMHAVSRHWEIAASVETPQSQVDANDSTTMAIDDWFPNVATFIQYGWGYNEQVRLSGILRTLPYRDLLTEKNLNRIGWGIQLSSVFRPFSPLTVYATANAGEGYGSLTNDLLMGQFDLINDPHRAGRMYAPFAYGWFGALQYYLVSNIFVSATFGQMSYKPSEQVAGFTYKYGLYSAVNIFWYMTPRIQVAGEFNWGKRKNFNGEHNEARRISLMAQFAF